MSKTVEQLIVEAIEHEGEHLFEISYILATGKFRVREFEIVGERGDSWVARDVEVPGSFNILIKKKIGLINGNDTMDLVAQTFGRDEIDYWKSEIANRRIENAENQLAKAEEVYDRAPDMPFSYKHTTARQLAKRELDNARDRLIAIKEEMDGYVI